MIEDLKTIQKIMITGADKRLSEIHNERINYCNQNNFYDIELQKEYEETLELKRRYKNIENILNDKDELINKIGQVLLEKIQQELIKM